MSIVRCLAVLGLAAGLGGCASLAGMHRVVTGQTSLTVADEVALLRLAEQVEAASMAHESSALGW